MLAYSEYDLYTDGRGLPGRVGPLPTYSPEEAACLKDRKWWAFLLSSIFTFLAGLFNILQQEKMCNWKYNINHFNQFSIQTGIFIVLIYRLLEFLFSGVLFGQPPATQGQGTNQGNKQPPTSSTQHGSQSSSGQHGHKSNEHLLESIDLNAETEAGASTDLGWMNEAKDWAGELISGQTTTGRILVSYIGVWNVQFDYWWFEQDWANQMTILTDNETPNTTILGCSRLSAINRLVGYIFHRCI